MGSAYGICKGSSSKTAAGSSTGADGSSIGAAFAFAVVVFVFLVDVLAVDVLAVDVLVVDVLVVDVFAADVFSVDVLARLFLGLEEDFVFVGSGAASSIATSVTGETASSTLFATSETFLTTGSAAFSGISKLAPQRPQTLNESIIRCWHIGQIFIP